MSYNRHPRAPNSSNTLRAVTPTRQGPPHKPRASSRSPLSTVAGGRKVSSSRDRANGPDTLHAKQELNDWDIEQYEMSDRQPSFYRSVDGHSAQPLLSGDDEERGRVGYGDSPEIAQPRTESQSPTPKARARARARAQARAQEIKPARDAVRTKFTYAAFFLVLSLISFTVQTETAGYIQHDLGWNKAYCMMYLTHGSWVFLWPFQLLILRIQQWNRPWKSFWRSHIELLRTTAQMVETGNRDVVWNQPSPVPYFIKMTSFVTCALTIAGGSWYVAVNMTTPSDLTAIYNCSAFFAYAFSVPLLGEKLRWGKSFAVLVAIVGVLVVAYGGKSAPVHSDTADVEKEVANRLLGNIIIGIGSILYGLYEVLYKWLACPPEGTSPWRGMIFANTFGTLIGAFTLTVLWIPLPILHYTGLETFQLPQGEQAWMMLISVLANVTFSGSFLILISLTSPVLSSVAALLTIFIVAIVDWLLTNQPLSSGAIIGGLLIIGAFGLLSWSTFKEMPDEMPDEVPDETPED